MPQKRTEKRTKDKLGLPVGIRCKGCGCGHFFVEKVEWRPDYVMRTRACRNCGNKIRTREVIVNSGKKSD